MTVYLRNGLSKKIHSEVPIQTLEIGIVNLMPNRQETEEQFISLLSQNEQNVALSFFYPETHQFRYSSAAAVKSHYETLTNGLKQKMDGWIVTGAPVEKLPFEMVDYWHELQAVITSFSEQKVPVIYECWAAQAALYQQYGFQKALRARKLSGVFAADTILSKSHLIYGFGAGGLFRMPQSRYTDLVLPQSGLPSELEVIASAPEVGPMVLTDSLTNAVFVTGHPEYTQYTLDREYQRDYQRGLVVDPPHNYYLNDSKEQVNYSWLTTSRQFYRNWVGQVMQKKVVKNL